MIVSRTPFRISFFGGGTDFPQWYFKNGGKVISTAINKYCYISARILPPFFKYNYRLRYFKDEHVSKIDQIKHPSIRETIKYKKFKNNLEIVHNADLPAQSGLGASSSFTVGLLNCVGAINNELISKKSLAMQAIDIEQNKIKEHVGSQDQMTAAFGGFNVINFNSDFIEVKPVNSKKNIEKLEKSIFLIFTGFQRSAQKIEKQKIKKIFYKESYYKEIQKITNRAEEKIYYSKNIVDDFSELMNEYWWYKKKLSEDVANSKINQIYNIGIKNGAYAGKITGAGGGGFMVFFIDNKKRKVLEEAFKNYITVPVSFDKIGSQIIYNQELR
ncbi:GHMP family kinase ATP-binding protein [Candidatus Pelagibacter sp.]|uniref:GHMP family kinase ATP-binding protein n=1 Tax=Candidatus Pelagibacter sp. TaxID=2024849 RepID=UPI003F875FEE